MDNSNREQPEGSTAKVKRPLTLIMDSETNGFVHEMTHFWCIVFKTYGKDKYYTFGEACDNPIEKTKDFLLHVLENYDLTLVAHFCYGFDFQAMEKFLGIDFDYNKIMGYDVNIVDTVDKSRRLQPDRRMPKGCPGSVKCPVTGRSKPVGPHGLEAYGYRVANMKPAIHDWLNGDPVIYLHRCKEDCKINELTYIALMEEERSMIL